MTPQELKESILWNAIQGKLTEHVANETLNEVVGQAILSSVSEEDAYFDIPSNWRWCRIGDILDLVNGKAFKPSDWSNSGLPIVRIQNLNDRNAPFNFCPGEIEDKYILSGGELLFSWSGTPGTSFGAFIWHGGRAALNQHIFIVYPKINLDYKYAMYALNGEIKIFIDKAHGGAGLKHITKKDFENCLLPIPPLAEQKRIVAKIEDLLPYIDRYEQAWSRLEDFNRRFPVDMQKSILQTAIQGKLVEQRPEEGTGEELYQQIQQEKQRLIKAGIIKKEKPLPEITEDEIPFDIPEGWKWVRLRSLGMFSSGKTPTMGICENWDNGTVSWITSKDMKQKYLSSSEMLITEKAAREMKIYPVGTILMVVRSGILKRLLPVAILTDSSTINQDIKALSLHIPEIAEFVYVILKGMESHILREYRKQVTTVDSLRFDDFQDMPVPLPPLAEQKRIVAKLEEILPLCDRLK